MFNTLAKPQRFSIYMRVATKSQLTPKPVPFQNVLTQPSLMVGNAPYVLPKQLKKPIYDYKGSFNFQYVMNAVTDKSHNESKELK